jgi:chromosome segregation ATPase
MTSDELERAIDFLLKSQANHEAQGARTDERLRQLVEQVSQQGADFSQRLDSLSGTQTSLMRILTQTLEAQARINETRRAADESLRATDESLRAAVESLREADESQREAHATLRVALVELAGRQSRTEESIARLAETQASSDRRLETFIKLVEEERGGGR